VSDRIDCTVSVQNAGGATNAPLGDFATPTFSSGGSSLSPLLTSNGGGSYTFTLTAPALATGSFQVFSTLSAGGSLSGSGVSFVVYGYPTVASTLSCAGSNSGTANVRTGEVIDCAISVQNAGGATNAPVGDFVVSVSGGAMYTVTSADGGHTFSFSFMFGSPSQQSVSVTQSGVNIVGSVFPLAVYGQPTGASMLSCSPNPIRVGDATTCVITVRDNSGLTTGESSDFAVFLQNVAANVVLTTTDNGYSYSFTRVLSASTPSLNFLVSVSVSGAVISQTVPVYAASSGLPSSLSTLTCGSIVPRVNGSLYCTVTFIDASGLPSSVFSSDVDVETSASSRRRSASTISNLATSDGGLSYTFFVSLPATPVASFTVAVLVQGQPVVSITFAVEGYSGTSSALSCVGVVSQSTNVTFGQNVACILLPRNMGGATSAAVGDFLFWVDGHAVPMQSITSSNGGASIGFIFNATHFGGSSSISYALATAPSVVVSTIFVNITYNCYAQCHICYSPTVCTACNFGYEGNNCSTVVNNCLVNNGGCPSICVFTGPGTNTCDAAASAGIGTNSAVGIAIGVGGLFIILVVVVVVLRRRREQARLGSQPFIKHTRVIDLDNAKVEDVNTPVAETRRKLPVFDDEGATTVSADGTKSEKDKQDTLAANREQDEEELLDYLENLLAPAPKSMQVKAWAYHHESWPKNWEKLGLDKPAAESDSDDDVPSPPKAKIEEPAQQAAATPKTQLGKATEPGKTQSASTPPKGASATQDATPVKMRKPSVKEGVDEIVTVASPKGDIRVVSHRNSTEISALQQSAAVSSPSAANADDGNLAALEVLQSAVGAFEKAATQGYLDVQPTASTAHVGSPSQPSQPTVVDGNDAALSVLMQDSAPAPKPESTPAPSTETTEHTRSATNEGFEPSAAPTDAVGGLAKAATEGYLSIEEK